MDIDQIIRLIQKNLQSNPPEASKSFDTAAGNAEPPSNSSMTDAARRYGKYGPTLSTRDALPPGYVRNSRGQTVKAEDINKVFPEGFGGLIAEQLKRGGEILGTGPKAQAAREVVSQSENIVPKPRPPGTEDFRLPRNFNNPFSFPVNNAAELGAELGLGDDSVATRPLPPMVSEFTRQGADAQQGADELDNVMLTLLASPTTSSGKPKDPSKAASDSVTYSAAKGIAGGTDYAEYNNQKGLIDSVSEGISSLLGNDTVSALMRVLARPEFVAPMGPGQSPVTNFINAAAADRTQRAATAAALKESQLEGFKAETDRLKALMPDPSKMPKLTGEVSKLYDSMAAAENTARLGKQIQESLSSSFMVSGAPGAAAEGFRAVAAMFGFDPGEMEQDEVKKRIAALKKEILQSRAFGREANKQELEILNRLVQGPDAFTSRTQILNSIKSLTESAERRRFNVAARLKAFGLPTEFNATKPEGPGFTRNN